MKSPDRETSELSIAEQAARWMCELQEDNGEQQAAFFTWLRQSPRHVEEFLFATTMWRKLQRFGHANPERVKRLIAAAKSVERDGSNVVALEGAERSHLASNLPASQNRRWTHKRWTLSISVAATLLISVAAGLWLAATGAPTFATAVGEQRIVQLDDGSRVDLNTRTRIAVRFSEEAREIHLLEGEALFTVARDPARPFLVDVDGVVIQAVGTQFNVYRQASGAKVSVLEGVVQIASGPEPTKLIAGEEARVTPGKVVAKRKAADIADTVAWRERRLIFRADRLEEVVAEVNRYSRRPIRIEDESARDVRLTAIFDADDPESLVRFLDQMDGVALERRDSEVIVRSR